MAKDIFEVVDQHHISTLLEAGWSVVGFTTHHHAELEDDNAEYITYRVLLQNGGALRVIEVHFEGASLDVVTEVKLAPGKVI